MGDFLLLVGGVGIEPTCLAAQHFKCCMYTNSIIRPLICFYLCGLFEDYDNLDKVFSSSLFYCLVYSR